MKITVTSTEQIVQFNDVPARVWAGETDSGIPVHCFITRIAVDEKENTEQFDRELQTHEPPRPELAVYPLKMIL
jgi:hypothetical protein